MSQAATASAAAPVPRDVRVDYIGLINELVRQFGDDQKSLVKGRMIDQELDVVEGNLFSGKLVKGTVGTIDPAKFYRKVKRGEITEAQFVECISVKRGTAEQYVSGKDLDRMSEFVAATPKLCVTRKPGLELGLVDVVKALGRIITPGARINVTAAAREPENAAA
jgi:hypothetical protein